MRRALRVAAHGKTAILPFAPVFARMAKDFQSVKQPLEFQSIVVEFLLVAAFAKLAKALEILSKGFSQALIL